METWSSATGGRPAQGHSAREGRCRPDDLRRPFYRAVLGAGAHACCWRPASAWGAGAEPTRHLCEQLRASRQPLLHAGGIWNVGPGRPNERACWAETALDAADPPRSPRRRSAHTQGPALPLRFLCLGLHLPSDQRQHVHPLLHGLAYDSIHDGPELLPTR